MIHKDEANPMWFGFKGGEHVLVRSFHGGPPLLARNFSDRKRRAFLDWAERQGYNMLSVNDFQEDLEAGGRWDLPDLWPLDAAEYRQIEEVLDDLARREILFYSFGGLFPATGTSKTKRTSPGSSGTTSPASARTGTSSSTWPGGRRRATSAPAR